MLSFLLIRVHKVDLKRPIKYKHTICESSLFWLYMRPIFPNLWSSANIKYQIPKNEEVS